MYSTSIQHVRRQPTPECRRFTLITCDMPSNMLVSRALCVYIGIGIGLADIFSGIDLSVYQSIGRMPISVVDYIKLITASNS